MQRLYLMWRNWQLVECSLLLSVKEGGTFIAWLWGKSLFMDVIMICFPFDVFGSSALLFLHFTGALPCLRLHNPCVDQLALMRIQIKSDKCWMWWMTPLQPAASVCKPMETVMRCQSWRFVCRASQLLRLRHVTKHEAVCSFLLLVQTRRLNKQTVCLPEGIGGTATFHLVFIWLTSGWHFYTCSGVCVTSRVWKYDLWPWQVEASVSK